MRLRLVDGKAIALRTIVATGFIGAFLFALVLSAAPQLHERIHQGTGATHECAVTLLISGNYAHTPFVAITVAPPPPQLAARFSQSAFELVSPRLELFRLEHAPPALS